MPSHRVVLPADKARYEEGKERGSDQPEFCPKQLSSSRPSSACHQKATQRRQRISTHRIPEVLACRRTAVSYSLSSVGVGRAADGDGDRAGGS